MFEIPETTLSLTGFRHIPVPEASAVIRIIWDLWPHLHPSVCMPINTTNETVCGKLTHSPFPRVAFGVFVVQTGALSLQSSSAAEILWRDTNKKCGHELHELTEETRTGKLNTVRQ